MDTSQNYYQILHVLPDAPAPVIKASYRAMMQKLRHHPDLGGEPSHAQRLNEAVETLCDPDRRAVYDRKLQAAANNVKMNPKPDMPAAGTVHATQQARNGTSSSSGRAAPQALLPTRPHCLFCKAGFSTIRTRGYYQSGDQCLQCQAPTEPIEQLNSSSSEELRRIYRHDHHALVRLWSHWPMDSHLHAQLLDLSLAGCAIEMDKSLPGGAVVLVDTAALKAICEVCYCCPMAGGSAFNLGLAFKTLQIKARPGTMFSAIA